LTEENNHVNRVNPVNLADKDWTDEYKLSKLMAQQRKNQYLAPQIFEGECICQGFGGHPCCPLNSKIGQMFAGLQDFAVRYEQQLYEVSECDVTSDEEDSKPDNSYLDDFLPANKKVTCSEESSFDDVNKFMEMSANDLEATLSASGVVCKLQSNLDESLDRALKAGICLVDGPPEP
jgi:hypothetical protein